MQSSKYPITHVLVDCENVGLDCLTDLVVKTDGWLLTFILFYNDTNKIKNIPLTQLKDVGYAVDEGRIKFVELTLPENMTKKQAKNALDFYIAFYMGTIMPFSPFNNHCVILSKDRDYDPLVFHVQKQYGEGRCERVDSYEKLAKQLGITIVPQDLLPKESDSQPEKSMKKTEPAQKNVEPTTKAAKKISNPKTFDLKNDFETAKVKLKNIAKKKRPSTKTKLQNFLKSLFAAKKTTDANIQSLMDSFQKAGFLELSKNNHVQYK